VAREWSGYDERVCSSYVLSCDGRHLVQSALRIWPDWRFSLSLFFICMLPRITVSQGGDRSTHVLLHIYGRWSPLYPNSNDNGRTLYLEWAGASADRKDSRATFCPRTHSTLT